MSVRIITIPDTHMVWIDLQNPSKEEQQEIAAQYKLDLYALSDSVEPSHLPKFEEQSNMNFLIVRMLLKNTQGTTVNIHQISSKIAVFYTDDFLITIHRNEVPFIDEMIEKYINTKRLRTITSIVVKLLRKVLLSYEEPLLQLSDEINKFEENMLLKKVQTHSLQHLFYLKNKANLSKKLLILTDDILDSIEVKKTERSSLQDIKDLHVRLVVLYDQFL
ncbi:MAG TPA: CorA family divalent cation transporter, partial [Flavobacterium sp.]|nr:CorA family divalent cation transporter [Flavobacterium sp.]